MDSNVINSFANDHVAILKDIRPFNLIFIVAIISAFFFLYLGNEYNFFSYFIIIQSLVILLVIQISTYANNSIFNIIIYIILILYYLFIIFFNISPFEYQSLFYIIIKTIMLLYILIFSQASNVTSVFSVQTILSTFLFILCSTLLYDYYIDFTMNRKN